MQVDNLSWGSTLVQVGRYGESDFDFRAERVSKSVEESCGRLNTDRIDILIAHDIEFGNLDQVGWLSVVIFAAPAGDRHCCMCSTMLES